LHIERARGKEKNKSREIEILSGNAYLSIDKRRTNDFMIPTYT